MDMLIGVVLGLILGGAITFGVVEKRRRELKDELHRYRQAPQPEPKREPAHTRVFPDLVAQAERDRETMRGQLVLQTPEGPRVFPLETSLVTIGRGLQRDILVEDDRVSRQQAEIHYQSSRYFIHDPGSPNGTFVNGVQVTTDKVLHDGDVVSFGGLEMTFHQDDSTT